MRDLFRSFEKHEVDYLLIGGLATILYGASQFTEDVDVWIPPSRDAARRFLRALADRDAVAYKLTPPVTIELLRRGHGFHFEIPCADPEPNVYIDMMGRPPRVGSFAKALARSRRFAAPWGGSVPTVATEELVELKKTDRAEDYPVISRLARLRVAEERRPTARLLAWAIANTFVLDDLVALVRAHGDRIKPSAVGDPARLLLDIRRRGLEPSDRDLDRVAEMLSLRERELRRAGRAYWRPMRDELRRLRAQGELIPQGTPVRELLRG